MKWISIKCREITLNFHTPQCPEHRMDLQKSLSRNSAASVQNLVLDLAPKPIPSHGKNDFMSMGIPQHYSQMKQSIIKLNISLG